MTGLQQVWRLSPVEVTRELQVRAAMAQDAARKPAPQPVVTAIDTESERRRDSALAGMRQKTQRAERVGGAARPVLWVNPDGSTNLREDPDRPDTTVCTMVHTDRPVITGTARIWSDAEDEAWHARERRADDLALAGFYGLQPCLDWGIVDPALASDPDLQG